MSVEERFARLEATVVELEAMVAERDVVIVELRSRIADLEAQLGQDSGYSSTPPWRDKTDRRQRRAEEAAQRKARWAAGSKPRSPGKQPGMPASTLERRAQPPSSMPPRRADAAPAQWLTLRSPWSTPGRVGWLVLAAGLSVVTLPC